jgi:molecular chaperone GrpE
MRQIETERDDIRIENETLQSQVIRLQSELRRAHNDIQRDRRQAKDKEKQAADKVRIDIAKRVMKVADEFSTAIKIANDQSMETKWFDGFKAMAEKIDNCLLSAGYRRFESIGEEMDPARHEALAMMPTSDESVGKIIQVVEAGYQDAETAEVVRVAKVLVGRRADKP